jgi:hypothetical protein
VSEINDGGPAFPVPYHPEQQWENPAGMTLRDYFAAKAMASYLMPAGSGQTWAQRSDFDYIAETAYLAADAMLRARGAA